MRLWLQAMLDQLAQRWPAAEARLLAAGLAQDAIEACLECQRWPEALRIAEAAHHPALERYRADYMAHLLATGQLAEAGRVREEEGDVQVRRFFWREFEPKYSPECAQPQRTSLRRARRRR